MDIIRHLLTQTLSYDLVVLKKRRLTALCVYVADDLLICFHLSGCLEEGLEALLKATGSNLLILKISHCPNLLTDRSLWLASCYCRALQAVTYRYTKKPGSKSPYASYHAWIRPQ